MAATGNTRRGQGSSRPQQVRIPGANALNYSPDLSYFKRIEAYGLKTQIQQEEELSMLFAQHSVDPNQLSGGQLPDMPPTITRDVVNNYAWTAGGRPVRRNHLHPGHLQ